MAGAASREPRTQTASREPYERGKGKADKGDDRETLMSVLRFGNPSDGMMMGLGLQCVVPVQETLGGEYKVMRRGEGVDRRGVG